MLLMTACTTEVGAEAGAELAASPVTSCILRYELNLFIYFSKECGFDEIIQEN